MTCPEFETLVNRIDEPVSGTEIMAMMRHMAACHSCRQAVHEQAAEAGRTLPRADLEQAERYVFSEVLPKLHRRMTDPEA